MEEIEKIAEEEEVTLAQRPERHHRKPDDGRGSFFMLRQIFNILFMIIGVIGLIVLVIWQWVLMFKTARALRNF